MVQNKFDIFLPLDIISKDIEGSTKKRHMAMGVGSTTKKDRQKERLSEKALSKLEMNASEKRIPIFSDHVHSWENTMGYIEESKAIDGKWNVAIALEDPATNEKVAKLITKKEHGTPIGLSIGGRVLDSHFEKDSKESVRVIDDIELFELSFVGIPANEDGSVISYIAKSFEGEDMAEKEIEAVETQKQAEVVETKAAEEPVVVAPVVDYVSKAELEEMKKSLIEEFSKQIAEIEPVKKSVAVATEKEVMLKEVESKAEDLDAKFDAALKKKFGILR